MGKPADVDRENPPSSQFPLLDVSRRYIAYSAIRNRCGWFELSPGCLLLIGRLEDSAHHTVALMDPPLADDNTGEGTSRD